MKNYFSIFIALLTVIFIYCFPTVKESASKAFEICWNSLAPSVFIFTVLSNIAINSDMSSFLKPVIGLFVKLFGISPCSVIAVLMGWTAGLPAGAVGVHQLYTNGSITKKEAEYLLSFCSISGISFIFGVLGGVVFGSTKIALILYLIQIVSSVTVALLMKEKNSVFGTIGCESNYNGAFSELIVMSVKKGVSSTAYICGYMIFFSVICDVLLTVLPLLPEFPLRATFEITSSSFMLNDFPFRTSLVLASALLSWCGMCVHLQIQSCTSGLSLKKYYVGKLLHVGISSLLTLMITYSEKTYVYKECLHINYRVYSADLFFIIIFFVVLGCFFLNNDVK